MYCPEMKKRWLVWNAWQALGVGKTAPIPRIQTVTESCGIPDFEEFPAVLFYLPISGVSMKQRPKSPLLLTKRTGLWQSGSVRAIIFVVVLLQNRRYYWPAQPF